ncbi:MAG: hypothetical protein IKD27_08300 [Oscillospiraceae bacterium]|nr:hypothetical protein [Oscillospiraceae bacterium]
MKDLIYCQHAIPKEELRYGFRSSAATGCGWIATYNALRLLGKRVNKEELIRYYERQLPLLHGNTGTSIWGPAAFFRHHGFRVQVELRRNRFDAVAAEHPVCILFYYWCKGLKLGAHFVALHKTDRGFVGYNTYSNSTGPDSYGDSLDGFLKKRGYFGCVLMGIKEK